MSDRNTQQPSGGSELTARTILVFWAPLAATMLMMAVEGPFVSAVIARMAEPKYNLAAFGVMVSLGFIVEAPIIMLMSAGAALVRNRDAFVKTRRFAMALNLWVTLSMLFVLIPPIFNLIARTVMHLPDRVADLTYVGLWLMVPWPAAIGYRRYYQGVLVRYNRTRFIALGTVLRFGMMALVSMILFYFSDWPGAYVGGAALTAGVVVEAAASRLMAAGPIRLLLAQPIEPIGGATITYSGIWKFYYPLALTSMLALGVRPLVTLLVGQGRMALESLAVLPVVHGLVFLFMCLGFSYQEASIALLGDRLENRKAMSRFSLWLGLVCSGGMILTAFTPLADVWFQTISGLSGQLARFSETPSRIMVLMPVLTCVSYFMRSALVVIRRTPALTWATALEVGVIVLAMGAAIFWLDLVGIKAMAWGLFLGCAASTAFLTWPYRKASVEMSVVPR